MGKLLSVIGLLVDIIYDIYYKIFVLPEIDALCAPPYNQLFIECHCL